MPQLTTQPIHLLFALTFFVSLPVFAEIDNWIYNPNNGHYYGLTQRGDWNDAQAEAVASGGHLVVIETALENQWVVATFTGPGTEENCWIGLTDQATEGVFLWTNGTPLGYSNWNGGEPNNAGDEDFVYMFMQDNVNSATPGLWNEVNFATGMAQGGQFGIAERSTAPETACWIFNEVTGHYYRLSDRGDWNQVQAEAELAGGYLVSINDAAENQWLYETFTDPGTEANCWIGLSDAAIEGTFVWVNGDPVVFTNWNGGEPNNQGDEDYAYMFMQNNVNSVTPGLWNEVNFATGMAQGGQYGIIERDSPPGGSTWTLQTDDADWPSRWGHGLVEFQGRLWVLGGVSGGTYYNDVWSSADGATWTEETPSANWGPRRTHTVLVFNGELWVLGGYNGGSTLNDVWSSPDGVSWTLKTASANWSARNAHASVVFNDRMWVIGGFGDTNDVWSSSDGIMWTQEVASAPWTERHDHAAVVHDGQIWITGGSRVSPNTYFNDVWSSPDGTNWTQETAGAAFSGRDSLAAVSANDRLWVFGGDNASSIRNNDIWSSNDGSLWIQSDPSVNVWGPRAHLRAVVWQEQIWITGGNAPSPVFNDVWSSSVSDCFCAFRDVFASEWAALAAAFSLDPDIASTPGKQIPERWGLAMIYASLCDRDAPHHQVTYETLQANLSALATENAGILTAIAPYRQVLAALLLVDQDQQDYLIDLTGLAGTYGVATMGARGSSVIYSDSGDADGDGSSNSLEYENVLSQSGSPDDFGAAAIDPLTNGLPIAPLNALPLFIVLSAVIFAIQCQKQYIRN